MKHVTMTVLLVLLSVLALSAGEDESKVLQIQTMAGIVAPYTAATNAIRGVQGAGAPWVISSVNGKLRASGRLQLEIHGLVLTSTGVNPSAIFRTIVSCQSIDSVGAPNVVNVGTDAFPATVAGDASIHADVDLPSPCIAPIVFVTLNNGRWIAATGF